MDKRSEEIRRLLERDDLSAAEMHVALVGVLMQENTRYQAQLEEAQRQLARVQRQMAEIEASRMALLAVSEALWREAATHPERAAHPLAHQATLRQRIYDRAYRAALLQAGATGQMRGDCTVAHPLPPGQA